MITLSSLMVDEWKLLEDFTKLNIEADIIEKGCLVASVRAQPTLFEDIIGLQDNDPVLVEIKANLDQRPDFSITEDGR